MVTFGILTEAWQNDQLSHLECPMLGVECEAELNLAAVVSNNEAILPILASDRESSMTLLKSWRYSSLYSHLKSRFVQTNLKLFLHLWEYFHKVYSGLGQKVVPWYVLIWEKIFT